MFSIQCTTCNAKLAVKSDDLIGQILACPKCGGMVLVERPQEKPLAQSLDDNLVPMYRKFPDALGSETESGIINQEKLDERKQESVLPPPIQPPVLEATVSELEQKLRKRLLQFLAGMLFFLVVAVGFLITFKGKEPLDPETAKQQTDSNFATVHAENTSPLEKDESKPVDDENHDAVTKQITENHKKGNSSSPSKIIDSEQKQAGEESPAVKEKHVELFPLPKKEDTPTTSIDSQNESETTGQADNETDDKKEEESINDLLSGIQRKLPGLVDSSAVLTMDIPERLSKQIFGITLNETPLISVLRRISSLTEIPITIDVDELFCREISIDRPISLELKGKTIGDVLTEILSPLELEPIIENQQISISVSPERRNHITERRFDVSDLVEQTKNAVDLRGRPVSNGQLTTEELANILRNLVDPIAFASFEQSKENVAGLQIDGSTLVVRHCLRILDRSQRILEQLRILRNLPQKTDISGENLVPEVFGWDAVECPMTLNYYQPVPLADILMQIESATNIRILVDHQSLHRALAPINTIQATVRCNRGTVNEALERLFASVDTAMLDYRIVGADLLVVSTQDDLRQNDKMTVEIHRYETSDSLLDENETPENLVRIIQASLEPESWISINNRSATIKEIRAKGSIFIDRPSGCLLVRQSQPIQRQLRLWLGKKLSSKTLDMP